MCREKTVVPAMTLMVSLAGFLSEPTPLFARATTKFAPAGQSPELTVRVYGFSGLSHRVLQGAETEAARMLRSVPIDLRWVNCTSQVNSGSCASPQLQTDLIIRFIPKAFSQASKSALGSAGSTGDYAAAFIFYDRVTAVRTQARLLPMVIGRVIAHEITHLLLPGQGHSSFGLMRGQWSADDLLPSSFACLGLPKRSVQLMQKEVLRRRLSARSSAVE
ncbi:MAG: hypothetical protein JWO80_5915 [Bryobacterales bacterium]|nr:hypothetical protein [Bryobacterales bacterium]